MRLRSRIVPTNRKTGMAAILEAADYFFEKNGRHVTFEYVLLGGINDAPAAGPRAGHGCCRAAGPRQPDSLQRGDGFALSPAGPEAVDRVFTALLKQAGISVKVRKRKGSEIDAACGQLRRKVEAGSGCKTSLDVRGYASLAFELPKEIRLPAASKGSSYPLPRRGLGRLVRSRGSRNFWTELSPADRV